MKKMGQRLFHVALYAKFCCCCSAITFLQVIFVKLYGLLLFIYFQNISYELISVTNFLRKAKRLRKAVVTRVDI